MSEPIDEVVAAVDLLTDEVEAAIRSARRARPAATACAGASPPATSAPASTPACRATPPARYAELMAAHSTMLFAVPEGIDDEHAIFADPFAVSLHSITRHPPPPGGKALVWGAGAISWVGSNAFGVEEVDGIRKHGIEHYLDLVQAGRIDLTGMLTHTFALSEWQDAFYAVADREHSGAIKVAIDPQR